MLFYLVNVNIHGQACFAEREEQAKKERAKLEGRKKGQAEQSEEARRSAEDRHQQEIKGALLLWLIFAVPIFAVVFFLEFYKGTMPVYQWKLRALQKVQLPYSPMWLTFSHGQLRHMHPAGILAKDGSRHRCYASSWAGAPVHIVCCPLCQVAIV